MLASCCDEQDEKLSRTSNPITQEPAWPVPVRNPSWLRLEPRGRMALADSFEQCQIALPCNASASLRLSLVPMPTAVTKGVKQQSEASRTSRLQAQGSRACACACTCVRGSAAQETSWKGAPTSKGYGWLASSLLGRLTSRPVNIQPARPVCVHQCCAAAWQMVPLHRRGGHTTADGTCGAHRRAAHQMAALERRLPKRRAREPMMLMLVC